MNDNHRLVIVLDGKRVDIYCTGDPNHVGDVAQYYARLLAEGWTFGWGTKIPPKQKDPAQDRSWTGPFCGG